MWGILTWIVCGLIAGAIARFLLPGRQPMGWIMTMILGIVGSFAGGTLANLFAGNGFTVAPSGMIGSILGALLVLFLYTKFAAK